MKTLIDYIYQLSEFEESEIKDFNNLDLKHFDLKVTDKKYYSVLMLVAKMNINLKMSADKIDYLVRNSNLDQMNINDFKAINYILSYNKRGALNLSPDTIEYLIKNTNLHYSTDMNYNTLMYVCKLNQTENLNLSAKIINYIIDNSDLMLVNENKENNLIYVLERGGVLTGNLSIPVESYAKIINDTLQLREADFYPQTIEKCLRYFDKVWPYIEDKDSFTQYVEENFYGKFKNQKELLTYKERKNLEGMIVDKEVKNKVIKL